MLSNSDADTIKAWLKNALGVAANHGHTKADLAVHCGVKKQAVDGWLRTGRITKSNLAKASGFLESAPTFVGAPAAAREYRPADNWPFRLVKLEEVVHLPKRRLERIDRMLRDQLNGWAEDDATDKRRSA